jgi:D-alanyl-D-alanine carboxypeptidase
MGGPTGRVLGVVGTAIALLIAAAVPAQAAKPSRAEQRLAKQLERVVETDAGPPGASALLRRGGRTTFLRAGEANVESGAPMRRNSHMRLASVSKAYSGAVALALVDRGVMGLDDTVGSRLPWVPAQWHPVTLRQLLGHTSGVPNMTEDQGYTDALVADLTGEPTPAELIGFMKDTDLNFPPGSEYRYSNTENILVGLMAESAAGRGYEELLAELVFEPLGMKRTALPRGTALPGPRIEGYELDPLENLTECCAMAWLWAAGGLYSTPREQTRFIRGYVSGKLFGGAARRAQFEFVSGASQPPVPGSMSAGLALFRYETPCGTVFGHTGNVFGYTQFTASRRSGRRSLTVSVNEQVVPELRPENFKPLKRAFRLAVCALVD